ncbi:DUF3892 domain-containing protein [Halomonas cupida]|uniref:DUF3892 domain-containing protein n=1 Tax=Halomonas cupida TaxID=44933 RepID=UPI003EFA99C4
MERRVTASGKDQDGDITSLCAHGASWSPRPKTSAIADIESGVHTYFVQDTAGRRADIHVVTVGLRKHLRTDPDSSCANNLDTLPNC